MHPPSSLLWRVSTKFAAKSRSDSHGANARDYAHCAANIARPRSRDQRQTIASTFPVGETDRTHLRSISIAMVALRRTNRRRGHPLITFINDGAEIRKILDHIGVESNPPKISKARGPPLWDACDAEPLEHFDAGLDSDAVQHWPDEDVDQSVNW